MKKQLFFFVTFLLLPFSITCAFKVLENVFEISLQTLKGKTITLAEYKGKRAIYLKF